MRIIYCIFFFLVLQANAYLDWKWPLAITHVDVKTLGGNTFKRLSEYFTDNENSRGKVIVRTNPSRRDGLYMVIGLNHDTLRLPEGTVICLEYVLAGDPAIYSQVLPLPLVDAFEIYLGLTDDRWTKKEPSDILCWRIRLQDAQKNVLAEKESALWSEKKD